jgi:hypothetical protein
MSDQVPSNEHRHICQSDIGLQRDPYSAACIMNMGSRRRLHSDGPFLADHRIQRHEPTLNQLIETDTSVERIATGFNKWTEGPVWTRAQSLFFAEIPGNSIIEWHDSQGLSAPLRLQGRDAVHRSETRLERNDMISNGLADFVTRR